MFAGVGNDIDAVFQWKNGEEYLLVIKTKRDSNG